MSQSITSDPHAGQPVLTAGLPVDTARTVVIMVHGRNAGPANILDLVPLIARPNVSYLAPAAANRSWYPNSFLAEIATNEPYLTSALNAVEHLVTSVENAGIKRDHIVLLGFSQGACLVSEFAIRHASRLGGVIAYSGGAIGPPGTRWQNSGRFDDTPMFFGCSDMDAHVPEARVRDTAAHCERMGAAVTTRIYQGMGHLVNDDEVFWARDLLDSLVY